MKLVGFVVAATLAFAPFQCPGDPDSQMRREESAPEAVWLLAEHLRHEGHTEARLDALQFLIRRYPNSRFAERARLELRGERPAARAPATQ